MSQNLVANLKDTIEFAADLAFADDDPKVGFGPEVSVPIDRVKVLIGFKAAIRFLQINASQAKNIQSSHRSRYSNAGAMQRLQLAVG